MVLIVGCPGIEIKKIESMFQFFPQNDRQELSIMNEEFVVTFLRLDKTFYSSWREKIYCTNIDAQCL